MYLITRKHSSLCIFFIILANCAKQGFPPGGPVDRFPVEIKKTVPATDATNVPLNTPIQIEFNEAVDRRSCEESIFITPLPPENVKYKWRRKRINIIFPDGLIQNRTYVITIGTGTKDRRNNPLQSSFSLAFSTGPYLDNGRISGRVHGDGSMEGTQIWAYDLKDTPDPNPAVTPPLYVTQASADGAFTLNYLATGRYRVFAVRDRDVNNLYNAEWDALGVSPGDVALADSARQTDQIFIRVAVRDTTMPFLSAAAAPDKNHVDLRFSESMDSTHINNKNNYIIMSDINTPDVISAYQDERNAAIVRLITGSQLADSVYTVRVLQGDDLWAHPLDPQKKEITFVGAGIADTTKPQLVTMIPPDSSRDALLAAAVELVFSEGMDLTSIENHFRLSDSLKNPVTGIFGWPNSAHVIFTPDSTLKGEMMYKVALPVDSVFDYSGNRFDDTLFVKHFETLNPDTLTSIAGYLSDADTSASGAFNMKAIDASGTLYEIRLPGPGPYRFQDIMPGRYTIEIYRDEDDNRRYSYGEAFPFMPAERFYVYPDTIQVRSRWADEEDDILFPK